MEQATRALVRTDLVLAERVIAGISELDALGARCEDRTYALLALQAPVARDLRLVVTALQVTERVDRMGRLACHVAKIVQRRHPEQAIPSELHDTFAEMGQQAVQAARAIEHSVANPLECRMSNLQRVDDRTDALRRQLLATVRRKDNPYQVRTGIDVALLCRFFERFVDQAVAVTGRLDYVVTGTSPR